MNIEVALPTWGEGAWPSMSWSHYRMPVIELTRMEDQPVVGTLTGDPSLTYSLAGGNDAGLFNLVNANRLDFSEAPDFEFPSDMDGNNVYEVEVTLTDGTDIVIQPFLITIGDDGMTTQTEQMQLAIDEIAEDVGTLQKNLGDTSTLTTAGVSTAVGALNNIESRLGTLELDPITATTVDSLIASAKTELIGGASTAGDTLGKLEGLIGGVDTRLTNAEQGINTLNTTVSALQSDKASQADMLAAQSAMTGLQGQVGTGNVSTRISDAVNAMRDSILGGAGAAADTLKELKDLITENEDLIASLNQIAANKVSFAVAQNLTSAQQDTARTNILAAGKVAFDALVAGIGDIAYDHKANYIAKRNAARAAA